MTINQSVKAAEAVIFAAGEGISLEALMNILEVDEKQLMYIIDMLKEKYNHDGSGVIVVSNTDSVAFTTAPDTADIVYKALSVKKNTPLSNAAMEALTIVAYNQPVSKGFVERVRGIDSSSVVNSLVDKGLLEEAGRIDVPGRPIAYRTTPLFLRTFGLSSLEELPEPKRSEGGEQFAGELAGMMEELPE